MLVYYRLTGLVASFALIYYTLVMYAIFRLVPVTLTLAGVAGFVLSIGMAVDANILIFERMKEELRLGKSLPAAVEAGFNRAWNSILDSNVSSLITATILYMFGSSVIRGFALVLIIGVLDLDVQRDRRHPDDPAGGRPPGAGRARPPGTGCATTSSRRSGPSGRQAGARRARVFDVIGKRRWFYIFSLLITIPGLFFILLTPFTDAGLQFTIDYTGGTRWEIRFEDPDVTPEQVEEVFAEQGLEASALSTQSGFIEIKTEQIVGLQVDEPAATPVATLPTGSGSPGPSGVRLGGAIGLGRALGLGAPPGASASPGSSPGASPSAPPTGNTADPDRGQARRGRDRAGGGARAHRRAAKPDHDRRRGELRPDQPGDPPDHRRLARHPALDHLPLPRRQVRGHRARLAAPRRHRRRRRCSRSWARSSTSRSTRCS